MNLQYIGNIRGVSEKYEAAIFLELGDTFKTQSPMNHGRHCVIVRKVPGSDDRAAVSGLGAMTFRMLWPAMLL